MKQYLTWITGRTIPALWMVAALTVASGAPPALADNSATAIASPSATTDRAQPLFGAIAGVVRNSAKAPVSGAMVTAARTDGKGIWTTISGSDGIYSIPNIAPGEYQLTTQAEGYPDVTASTLQVSAGKATRTDIAMVASLPAPAVISSNTPRARRTGGKQRGTQYDSQPGAAFVEEIGNGAIGRRARHRRSGEHRLAHPADFSF